MADLFTQKSSILHRCEAKERLKRPLFNCFRYHQPGHVVLFCTLAGFKKLFCLILVFQLSHVPSASSQVESFVFHQDIFHDQVSENAKQRFCFANLLSKDA